MKKLVYMINLTKNIISWYGLQFCIFFSFHSEISAWKYSEILCGFGFSSFTFFFSFRKQTLTSIMYRKKYIFFVVFYNLKWLFEKEILICYESTKFFIVYQNHVFKHIFHENLENKKKRMYNFFCEWKKNKLCLSSHKYLNYCLR